MNTMRARNELQRIKGVTEQLAVVLSELERVSIHLDSTVDSFTRLVNSGHHSPDRNWSEQSEAGMLLESLVCNYTHLPLSFVIGLITGTLEKLTRLRPVEIDPANTALRNLCSCPSMGSGPSVPATGQTSTAESRSSAGAGGTKEIAFWEHTRGGEELPETPNF